MVTEVDSLQATRCREVLVAIRKIIRAIDRHSRYLAQHFALTGPQLYVLQALTNTGGATPGLLARQCSMSQTTMTGILHRLEKGKLVARRRSEEDKRKVLVELTDAGQKLLDQTPPDLQECFVHAFGALQDWEQNQIVSTLQRVVVMMEATDLDSSPILATGSIDQQVVTTPDAEGNKRSQADRVDGGST